MHRATIILIYGLAGLIYSGCTDMGESLTSTKWTPTDGVDFRTVRMYAYSGYDTSGTLLVTGKLNLVFSDSGSVSGLWEIAAAPGVMPQGLGPQIGKGLLAGWWEPSAIGLNFNPSFVDNNVVLTGTLSAQRITGRWDYIGLAGVLRYGTFVALLQSSTR